MKLFFVILMLVGNVIAQSEPIENGWKGIKVFKTTRAEVERILAVPSEKVNQVDISYRTKDGSLIHFAFAHPPCSNEGRGRFKVPENTVTEYIVALKDGIDIAKLNWRRELYERYEDKHSRGVTHYQNLKSGITVVTEYQGGTEKVFRIEFNRTIDCVKRLICEKYKDS